MARETHRWCPVCDPPRGIFRPVPLDPSGLAGPTRGQARGPNWRQVWRGHYVPSSIDGSVPEQRVLEASVLLPQGGVVTGWGALRLRRANFFDGLRPDGVTLRPVQLNTPADHTFRQRPGVVFSQDRITPDEITHTLATPVASVERALFDEMRHRDDYREATVDLDMAAAAELTSIFRMRNYVDAKPGWDGVPIARAALDHADEHSRSPNETRMRLVWMLDADLPRPLVNIPVYDRRHRLLGVPDLLDPVAGVVGEYDGADHRGAVRHSKDVDREGGYRRHGLEFFRITGPDMHHKSRMVDRMLSTRERALWLPEDDRAWYVPERESLGPSLDALLTERELIRDLYDQGERH